MCKITIMAPASAHVRARDGTPKALPKTGVAIKWS